MHKNTPLYDYIGIIAQPFAVLQQKAGENREFAGGQKREKRKNRLF